LSSSAFVRASSNCDAAARSSACCHDRSNRIERLRSSFSSFCRLSSWLCRSAPSRA
jgi:hypothetical protein